jgi:hypothetical protein
MAATPPLACKDMRSMTLFSMATENLQRQVSANCCLSRQEKHLIHINPSKELTMIAIRHTTLMLSLAAALALPALVRAEEAAPAAPAPEAIAGTPEQIVIMPIPGMGMRHRAMHGESCDMHKGGRMGDGKPCMMGGDCRMGDGGGMADVRLDALEKRMDMMQMMMEMMMKQQAGSKP